MNSFFSHLTCSACSENHSKYILQNVCKGCGRPLLAAYAISKSFKKEQLRDRPANMWRYREMLPVEQEENIISLGEGMTPLMYAKNLGDSVGMKNLYIKDESMNPTGSFKARGLGMAVSKAKEYGITKCVVPTAGNAGGAMSAYCAKAGIEAHVFMPVLTPDPFKAECTFFQAHLTLVEGNISDCGKLVQDRKATEDWFDVSTLKEPYRIEGKKTMGYEIAEQMNWELPDVILYPTGGGTGLIGMWKAFAEMEELGWISSKRPRMVAVQASTCAPVVNAYKEGKTQAVFIEKAYTVANGLCVPKPFGDTLILKVLAESKGRAVAVSDEEIINGIKEIAAHEGIFAAPEGGALFPALLHLLDEEWIRPSDKVLLLNTGSAYKYINSIYQPESKSSANFIKRQRQRVD